MRENSVDRDASMLLRFNQNLPAAWRARIWGLFVEQVPLPMCRQKRLSSINWLFETLLIVKSYNFHSTNSAIATGGQHAG